MKWSSKHVFDIKDYTREEIEAVLDVARGYRESMRGRPARTFDHLRGYALLNMFFEPSTRTRISFELAGKRLGMHVVDFGAGASSLNKSESIEDTIQTLNAMNVDAVVVRHSVIGTPQIVAANTSASVINAGDGTHAHPTQAFLDLLTMLEKGIDFAQAHVAIVGDIMHSRVARSNIYGLTRLGAKVTLVGPPTLLPPEFSELGVNVEYDFDRVVPEVDVLYMLRVQRERMDRTFFPSVGEYSSLYGLNDTRLSKAKSNVLVMHPGPVNRGVELQGSVMDGDRSFILEQVSCGVAVRMALLQLCVGGRMNQ